MLISHDHYDHLDLPTQLRRLTARGDSTFIVPAGAFSFTGSLEGVAVHCVPALHFSRRGIFDRNQTLWCGYVIECQERRVYFAGATAFGRHPVHMAPDDAVGAHEILGAKTSVAIHHGTLQLHHGTFQLTVEGIDTPKKQLIAGAQDASFLVLNNGQFPKIPC